MRSGEQISLSEETHAQLINHPSEWFLAHAEPMRITLVLQGWVFWQSRETPTCWGISHRTHGTVMENRWHRSSGPTGAPPISHKWYTPEQEPVHEIAPAEMSDYNIIRFYLLASINKWLC